jgi:hypothetical protein
MDNYENIREVRTPQKLRGHILVGRKEVPGCPVI